MRALKNKIADSLLAVTLALAAAPASAHPLMVRIQHDFWTQNATLGLLAPVAGFELAPSDCARFETIYDASGEAIGRKAVGLC
jgi:hypothetical protein